MPSSILSVTLPRDLGRPFKCVDDPELMRTEVSGDRSGSLDMVAGR